MTFRDDVVLTLAAVALLASASSAPTSGAVTYRGSYDSAASGPRSLSPFSAPPPQVVLSMSYEPGPAPVVNYEQDRTTIGGRAPSRPGEDFTVITPDGLQWLGRALRGCAEVERVRDRDGLLTLSFPPACLGHPAWVQPVHGGGVPGRRVLAPRP